MRPMRSKERHLRRARGGTAGINGCARGGTVAHKHLGIQALSALPGEGAVRGTARQRNEIRSGGHRLVRAGDQDSQGPGQHNVEVELSRCGATATTAL